MMQLRTEYYFPVIILGALVCSALFSIVVRWIARRFCIMDEPTGGRKIHQKRTALWGGAVTGGVLIVALLVMMAMGATDGLRLAQIVGFVIAIGVLLFGGMLDDALDLPPWAQFISPLLASLIIVISGSGIVQVTDPGGGDAISLVWWQLRLSDSWVLSFPSDLLTIVWLLVVTYAMKFLDGLDGLVAGLVIIGAMLIAGLAASDAYFQPVIAVIALAIAAIHLGFLPFNKTGSIFLGEAGSTIAGFSLGVLAIISGAKTAIAATALGVPLVDIVVVVIGRLVRGKSPFKGDNSHLHFRLLAAGLSPRGAVRLIWGIALVFGLTALSLQTRGKLFLFAGLVALVLLISYGSYVRARKKSHRA